MRTQRYKVTKSKTTNEVYILDKRTGTTHRHSLGEFVFGQGLFNPDTSNYPDYVHTAIWNEE